LEDSGMAVTTMSFAQELAAYAREKDQLLADAGKFVLIHGDQIAGVWDTYDDALRAGYKAFGVDTPFLVKRIEAIERVQFFGRNLTCQP